MNKIMWTSRAVKQIKRLPSNDQKTVYEKVFSLSEMPDVSQVIALKNHLYGYRLRIGRYRVLFDYDGEVHIVEIQEVRKRDEQTY